MTSSIPADPKMLRMLTCATHGLRRWQGHIMCDDCGRVFQTIDERKARFAPPTCLCGRDLMPPKSEQIGDRLGLTVAGSGKIYDRDGKEVKPFQIRDNAAWMARPICYLCFRVVIKKFGGTIPRWAEERAQRDGN